MSSTAPTCVIEFEAIPFGCPLHVWRVQITARCPHCAKEACLVPRGDHARLLCACGYAAPLPASIENIVRSLLLDAVCRAPVPVDTPLPVGERRGR